jgi:spore coat polysaccharide biosynthesis protein SpsF
MSNTNTVAIIQARMTSSRLPGKVLRDLGGEPMLARVVERVRQAKTIQRLVVATTRDVSDDAVVDLCASRGYEWYRGSQQDVLDRFYQAASRAKAEVVVRITADCPVVDPRLIDETVQVFLRKDAVPDPIDFAASRLPPPYTRTYPIGQDIEVCSFAGLERAWRDADQPYHREHVMPYFYEGIQPERCVKKTAQAGYLDVFQSQRGYIVVQLNYEPDCGKYRWTVDTQADMELLQRIFAHFGGRVDFSWQEILALVQSDPALSGLNAGVYHKDFHESETKK